MKATLTIVLNEVAALTATADFPDVGVRTLVEYDSRLEPWFENKWTTLTEFEEAMQRAAIALNGRISAAYKRSSGKSASGAS